uniref:Uncharacterized protein n=1 Tax=Octactis speculum TaxID=3111310 RepID=A0A7S2CZL6_9STRA|mmetsp:Transcript_41273/g.56247  ORF Transcript_41273/g.56247 Transcript_41273/m.56247 type:complete len:112 (+) Transcript_41273:475-810(+)
MPMKLKYTGFFQCSHQIHRWTDEIILEEQIQIVHDQKLGERSCLNLVNSDTPMTKIGQAVHVLHMDAFHARVRPIKRIIGWEIVSRDNGDRQVLFHLIALANEPSLPKGSV